MDDGHYIEPLLDLLVDEEHAVIPELVVPAQWMPARMPAPCEGSVRLCVALLGDAIERAALKPRERLRVRAWVREPWDGQYPIPFGMVAQVLRLDCVALSQGVLQRLDSFDAGVVHQAQRHRSVAREKVLEVVAA